MKFQLTSIEKKWILYDVGNSAFILLVSTIMPIYFNYLSENAGLSPASYVAYWGYAASFVTLIVAVLGPILGTLADTKNFKKRLFGASLIIGVTGCILLGFTTSWTWFLGVYIIGKIGYSATIILYDSMLCDITTDERMDSVSSIGYAWGYLGSCLPFALSLLLILFQKQLHLSMHHAMMAAFAINGLWWLLMTLPLLKNYRQLHFAEPEHHPVRGSFRRLKESLADVKKDKKVLIFLLSFFFYIDGVYTIIDMATAYGQALGLDSTGLLLALLTTQLVAFPCALFFGKISRKVSAERLITFCILAYTGIAVFAIQLDTQLEFWILAVCVGIFQGGIQALSRSYFAKITPKEKSGEYFGLMDICGKGASFLGTTLVAAFTQITGSASGGVSTLTVLFLIGLVLFRYSISLEGESRTQAPEDVQPEM